MEWYRLPKAPRILGHEIAGEIVESKSNQYRVGERVFVSHHVPCNHCKFCREDNHTACDTLHSGNYDPGGYSEYVRVPRINVDYGVYVLPEQVSYLEGTMIEPLACSVRGLGLINIRENHTVLILGCGISGILNIQIAKLTGARVIATDINEYRLKKAKEFGADAVLRGDQELNSRWIGSSSAPGPTPRWSRPLNASIRKGSSSSLPSPTGISPSPSPTFGAMNSP